MSACPLTWVDVRSSTSQIQSESLSSTSVITMVGNGFTNEECTDTNKDEATECSMRMPSPVTVCIPKVEPCYDSVSDWNEDLLNTDELIGSAIPFITPYKIKDPIILLEKCDKIWETLKLIKDVQSSKSTNTLNSVSLENENHKSYIKYQPNVLGNNNVTLPNLKLCVKSTQRLYPCPTCGKPYLHKRDLRHHSAKIHGIFMSLDRPRNNVPGKQSVSKDKETSVAETEQNMVKKLNLKRSHTKQINPSPKSAKSNTNESNQESVSSSQSQGKKTNISMHTKDTLINSENVKKDQKKAISRKELSQNSTLSSACKECILCKYFVKDLRKHLVDYHKIQATDFMLKELEKTSTVLKVNKSKNDIGNTNNNNSLRNDPVSNNKQQFQRNEKRKLNVSYTRHEKRFKIDNNTSKVNSYQCEICSGLYRPHHIKRHLVGHRNRGETKENFHLINYNYSDPSDISGFEDRDKSNSTSLFKNNKKGKRIPRKRNEFYRINDSKGNTTCSCGRSFRNPYTLYVHKRSCKFQNDEMEEYAIGSAKETVENSLAKINIKIKKRNDSYEIVGREREKPEELEDAAKDTDPLTDPCDQDVENDKQENNEITGSSKYSDEHKFLKIAKIDEDSDIDVDIEENSQSGSTISNSNQKNNNRDNLLTNELINQSEEKESEPITRRSRYSRITSNVKGSPKSLLESHIIEKQNICVCGTLFDTRKALDVHTLKHQAHSRLICGYCDTTFPDIDMWKSHQCDHKKAKLFIDIPLEIDCHLCTTTFSSYTAFDEHVRTQHYNPIIPYLCFQCDKRFCNTTVRKNHINSEHDKYVCPICDVTYTDKMKTRHEGYHYGLGYPCHLCKKTYSAKSYFNKHMQKTHPVRRSLNKVTCDSNLAS
ncbi:uncharacterized protein LOC143360608 [Halictus rubicundus]|uniref:uncharacterized protein LOC143360608 n=1 Tax=Halictus rubicundus TaxID=77578 RepID=UPI00403514B1